MREEEHFGWPPTVVGRCRKRARPAHSNDSEQEANDEQNT